jgi:hypothetical protein
MDKKNNLHILGIVSIVTIVGIVLMIVSISNQKFYGCSTESDDVGKVISTLDSRPDYLSCSDSDGGENWYVKGVVIGPDKYAGGNLGADYCDSGLDPNGLMEGFCNAGYVDFKLYSCPNGCSDGACIPLETPKCSESDGGIEYYERGTITGNDRHGNGNPGVDYCTFESNINLMEGFCDGGYVIYISYDCPNGCKDGACI